MTLTPSDQTSTPRRRLLGLSVLVVAPVALLVAIAARSIRYESLAAREQAIADANDVAEWALVQSQAMYFPVGELLARLPFETLTEIERSPLLQPSQPTDDFVLWLQQLKNFSGHQLHACLLDPHGALLYPKPVPPPSETRWTEVATAHEQCRAIYRRYSDAATKPLPPGSPIYRFIDVDGTEWCTWQLEQRTAGYRLLLALPAKEFRAVAATTFDPRRAGLFSSLKRKLVGPAYAQTTAWSVPFKDYMQLAVMLGESDNLVYVARSSEPVVTKLNAVGGRANEHSQLKWADSNSPRVLAESGGGVQYIGPWAPVWLGDSKQSQIFRCVVSVRDPKRISAHVRRQTWVFAALIGLATIGAGAGLRAGWRAYREQERLGVAKSNFISSVSHELRTPLASVRLMAESLQRGAVSSADKQAEYYRLIVQECRRVSGLVENVLDLSRIEQGRKDYTFEWCDAERLCRETVAAIAPFAAAKAVDVSYACAGDPTTVYCDAAALQQVLVNLVDNAIKHSPPRAVVDVKATFAPAQLRMEVADRGPGIPAADHAKIFEPFFRRGSELRRETTGVGLGLAIVKHAIDAHGGMIVVQDNVPTGARFVITLPARTESDRLNRTTT